MINGVLTNFNGIHSQRIQKVVKPMVLELQKEFISKGKKLTPETEDLVHKLASIKELLSRKESRKVSPNPVEYIDKMPDCLLNLFK